MLVRVTGARRQEGFTFLPLAAAAMTLLVTFVALVVTPSAAMAQEDQLKTRLYASDAHAPPGGFWRLYGETHCESTYATLKYVTHDGEFDYTSQAVKIGRTNARFMYEFTVVIAVPHDARLDRAEVFADPACGNPDASPSDTVDVYAEAAVLALSVTGGKRLTVAGAGCYGDPDGKVTIKSSRGSSAVATLRGARFSATFTGPPGPVTFSVGAPDCRGSRRPASVTARFTAAASPSPTRQPSPTPPPTQPVSHSPTPSPSASAPSSPAPSTATTSSTPPTLPSTKATDEDAAVPPGLLLGIAGTLIAVAGAVFWWRIRRP